MEPNYKTTKGTYREIVRQVTEIRDVHAPTIESAQEYDRVFSTKYSTKDHVEVIGTNGRLGINIDIGNFGLLNRIKQAYGLIRGRNMSVLGGGPTKEEIENNPVVMQYLADSQAFNQALKDKKAQLQSEVLSDTQFEVTEQGIEAISLEDRLTK